MKARKAKGLHTPAETDPEQRRPAVSRSHLQRQCDPCRPVLPLPARQPSSGLPDSTTDSQQSSRCGLLDKLRNQLRKPSRRYSVRVAESRDHQLAPHRRLNPSGGPGTESSGRQSHHEAVQEATSPERIGKCRHPGCPGIAPGKLRRRAW